MELGLSKMMQIVRTFCCMAIISAFANTTHNENMLANNNMRDTSQERIHELPSATHKGGGKGLRVGISDIYVTANFLYWKIVQDGLRYAANGIDSSTIVIGPPVPQGKVVSVGSDWTPGFKAGFGINFNHDCWDFFAQYTWIRACDSSKIGILDRSGEVALQSNFIFPSYQLFSIGFAFWDAQADWDMSFNVIDLELGKTHFLSQNFSLRPFISLKGTWQEQDLKIIYSQALTTTPQFYRLKSEVDVWGVGLRGGFNLAYFMTKRWSFFGNFAYTAMWTCYYELDRTDIVFPPVSEGGFNATGRTTANIANDTYYTMKNILEIELGLRWEIWWSNDDYHFAIQAGWEQQIWVNWGQIPLPDDNPTEHDLSLGGLNLKARFDF